MLNLQEFYDDPNSFNLFTSSLLHMLRSTSIACPQLSICLIQLWFPVASNIITTNIKNNASVPSCIQYSRQTWLKFLEALMIAFKRISITKSFEINQVKVIIQCMIRIINLKAEVIEYDSNYDGTFNESLDKPYRRGTLTSEVDSALVDDYIYCCNSVFWVCIS